MTAAGVRTVLRLRRDARLSDKHDGLQIAAPQCVLSFATLPASLRTALAALAEGEHAQEEVAAPIVAADGFPALFRFQRLLAGLDAEGLLEHAVTADGATLARLRPIGRGATVFPTTSERGVPVKLSRFAIVSAEGGCLVARAPGSHLALELAALPAAGLLAALADWCDPIARGSGSPEAGAALLRLFAAAGLLCPGGPDDDPETQRQELAQWSVADRWMHARSRGPKTVAGYGGTYRDAHRFAPPPAAPPARRCTRVPLAVPDLAAIGRGDTRLTEALESRRSVREHDAARPITVDQLGELLYRAARQRAAFAGTDGQELADRPYPSGGAVHELEIYPLITTCTGLEPGLWHYRAAAHELELVSEPVPATAALLAGARDAAVMGHDPQIVLLITARFGRVMWKYDAVAYSLVLKHVGVLYQTLYLIGTAMKLAVCALGGGDAADFAVASGLDPAGEGTVGELVLGSAPKILRHPFEARRASAAGT